MNEKVKTIIFFFIFFSIIFLIPYIWRHDRDEDIKKHSKYTFAQITKKTGSLINGHNWQYEFYFNKKQYFGYWPTHNDYSVHIGEYFIVNFSQKDPNHNRINYSYKAKNVTKDILNKIWDTIPMELLANTTKQ